MKHIKLIDKSKIENSSNQVNYSHILISDAIINDIIEQFALEKIIDRTERKYFVAIEKNRRGWYIKCQVITFSIHFVVDLWHQPPVINKTQAIHRYLERFSDNPLLYALAKYTIDKLQSDLLSDDDSKGEHSSFIDKVEALKKCFK